MLVQTFNGGLSTRLAPQMLQLNEAVVYTNVDETVGTLKSVKTSKDTGLRSDLYAHYFEAGKEWVSRPSYTCYLPYNLDLLFCNNGILQRRKNGLTSTVGVAAPLTAPVVSTAALAGPTAVSTLVTQGSGLPKAKYSYLVVNAASTSVSTGLRIDVSASGTVTLIGANQAYSQVPADVVATQAGNFSVTFSNPVPATALGAVGFEIYRAYRGAWRRVGVLATANATVTDSTLDITTSKQLSSSSFGALKGTYQYVYTNYNPVTGAESAPSPLSAEVDLESGGSATISFSSSGTVKLYRIGGNLSQFSLVATVTGTSYVDSTPDENVLGDILTTEGYGVPPPQISYIEEAYGVVFAAAGNTLYFTPPGKPDAWPASNAIEFTEQLTGLAAVANGILVFTALSTYIITGTSAQSFARQLVDSNQGCIHAASIQKWGGAAIWVSSDGICVSQGGPAQVISRPKLGKVSLNVTSSALYDDSYYAVQSDGTALVASLAYGEVFKLLSLGFSSLVVSKDTLFGWKQGTLWSLFTGNEFEELEYLSPRFIEGRATKDKVYKKVYFYAEGDIIIDIIVNNVIVLAGAKLDSGQTTELSVPQDSSRGNFIQFRVKGKGELYEFEYEVA